jgi:hypothetical protein
MTAVEAEVLWSVMWLRITPESRLKSAARKEINHLTAVGIVREPGDPQLPYTLSKEAAAGLQLVPYSGTDPTSFPAAQLGSRRFRRLGGTPSILQSGLPHLPQRRFREALRASLAELKDARPDEMAE